MIMLKDDLLLDSARPFSDENQSGNQTGCPKSYFSGVPESYICPDDYQWYVLRVSYSREMKIQELLRSRGIRTFIPMIWRRKEVDGKTVKILVPAVNNLCFAFSDRNNLDEFIHGFGEASPVHFYWDKATRMPLVVPEKAMEDFIKVSSTMDEDLIYLTQINPKLREGQAVRVRNGSFAGVEGRIVRIRKSRRILVEIPGMLAVATTYVRPEILELV